MAKKVRKTTEKDGKLYTVRGVELCYASKTMTAAEFWSFILGGLRRLTKYWKPKLDCLKAARRDYTGTDKRTKWEYQCKQCQKWHKQKDVEVDHITPCGGINGAEKIAGWVERAFVEIEGYQIMCKPCHKIKGVQEDKVTQSMKNLYPREESSYRNMMSRCYNPRATGYQWYGERGIVVCDSWRGNFKAFYSDMGQRPEHTSLDRVDCNGPYSKENCRWATSMEQARNTSSNNFLIYNGVMRCIEEWAAILEMKSNTLVYRIKRHWAVGEALGFDKRERERKVYNGRVSAENILEIIARSDNGETQLTLSKEYGIDRSQISRLYNQFKSHEYLLQKEEKL